MLKKFFIFFIPLLLYSCSFGFKKAPERTNPLDPLYIKNGTITGKITDGNNNPVTFFDIQIEKDLNIWDNEPYSYAWIKNNNGEYKYYKEAGTYDIWARPHSFPTTNEYYSAWRMNVSILESETTTEDIKVMQLLTYPSPGQTIADTTPNFSGTPYPGAQDYACEMSKWTSGEWKYLWTYWGEPPGSALQIPYPPEFPLESGNRYLIQIWVYSTYITSDIYPYEFDYRLAYCECIFNVQ